MGVILGLGIIWTLYGLAGILGFQIVDEKYKNHEWTRNYKRYRGISWIMLGVPWIILYLLTRGKEIDRMVMCLLVLVCGIPSIIYTLVNERKYKLIVK